MAFIIIKLSYAGYNVQVQDDISIEYGAIFHLLLVAHFKFYVKK